VAAGGRRGAASSNARTSADTDPATLASIGIAGSPAPAANQPQPLDLDFGRGLDVGVAHVRRSFPLDQEDVRFLVRPGAVLDASRNDEQLSLAELDVAIAKLDRHLSLEHEEEVVRVRMRVPDELAPDLATWIL
jgi:hypothetical protein